MRTRLGLWISIMLTCSGVSLAADLSPELEKEAKQIENLLISPCCWRQPVAVHYSPASDEVRQGVREMLASGLERDAIIEKYVAEYGERILSKPPAEGFGTLAYFLPILFLAGGAALAAVVIRKLRPQERPVEVDASAEEKKERPYSKKLEKELWG